MTIGTRGLRLVGIPNWLQSNAQRAQCYKRRLCVHVVDSRFTVGFGVRTVERVVNTCTSTVPGNASSMSYFLLGVCIQVVLIQVLVL